MRQAIEELGNRGQTIPENHFLLIPRNEALAKDGQQLTKPFHYRHRLTPRSVKASPWQTYLEFTNSPVMPLRCLQSATTDFQKVEIWQSEASCEFRVAGAIHAWWHRDRFLTGLAWDNLAAASLLRPAGPPTSVLMLGLAGGTTLHTLRHLLPDCQFTAVDIDASMVRLAEKHMALKSCKAKVHIADAYEWADTHDETFDIVIDDCYLAGEDDVFRPERKPERGINKLIQLLNPGGLFLTNLVTGSGHRRMQSGTRAAFKRSFKEVRSVTTPESMNETLVGGNAVLSASALDAWTPSFSTRKDRDFWERIEVRKLK